MGLINKVGAVGTESLSSERDNHYWIWNGQHGVEMSMGSPLLDECIISTRAYELSKLAPQKVDKAARHVIFALITTVGLMLGCLLFYIGVGIAEKYMYPSQAVILKPTKAVYSHQIKPSGRGRYYL
jgi:hypothetical protein